MKKPPEVAAVTAAGDNLLAEFKTLAAHAEELVKTTANVSGDGIAAAREKMMETLSDLRAKVVKFERSAVESAKEAARATDAYVHEKPWQAVAAAALVGLILGFLTRGSRRD